MQNIKYHSLNVASILIFSYITAATINQVVKYAISPSYEKAFSTARRNPVRNIPKSFESYKNVLECGFFKIASLADTAGQGENAVGSIEELTLIGTITGPPAIARAMVQKKGETTPGVFALYKISGDINNDVYGYRLVRIDSSKIYLDANGQRIVLDLFGAKNVDGQKKGPEGGGQNVKQQLSRAEIKQKVFNNVDNALYGINSAPHRVNGQIVGYKLVTVRPYNILYKFGARSGDIVKRVNGQSLDSTQKLYTLWEAMKTESRITVDIERQGKLVTYVFNISD